ncbi:plastocyanin/azurin family copper-binding protein [Antrihabitans sp. YC2-6]|uniref:cupredoxin domain-containing protein n=1 Tax=Antrihabitans sp. YC2-6 TaxID=2799498 RepID=UPI0027DB7A5C|nr:plastocyanin/azurin family copper-binding protein [Antrihabitans sp. YC2-6]
MTPLRRRPALSLRRFAVALALAATLTACGAEKSDDQPAQAEPGVVLVKDMQFTPATITVQAGESVTWRFDDGGVPHNVQGAKPADTLIHSPILRDNSYTVTFDTPGTYQYGCTLHPQMTGSVVVT